MIFEGVIEFLMEYLVIIEIFLIDLCYNEIFLGFYKEVIDYFIILL